MMELILKVSEIETCADGTKILKFSEDMESLLCPADIFEIYFTIRGENE